MQVVSVPTDMWAKLTHAPSHQVNKCFKDVLGKVEVHFSPQKWPKKPSHSI